MAVQSYPRRNQVDAVRQDLVPLGVQHEIGAAALIDTETPVRIAVLASTPTAVDYTHFARQHLDVELAQAHTAYNPVMVQYYMDSALLYIDTSRLLSDNGRQTVVRTGESIGVARKVAGTLRVPFA